MKKPIVTTRISARILYLSSNKKKKKIKILKSREPIKSPDCESRGMKSYGGREEVRFLIKTNEVPEEINFFFPPSWKNSYFQLASRIQICSEERGDK